MGQQENNIETMIKDVISNYVKETGMWPKYIYLGKLEYNLLSKKCRDKFFYLTELVKDKNNIIRGKKVKVFYFESIRVLEVKRNSFLRIGN